MPSHICVFIAISSHSSSMSLTSKNWNETFTTDLNKIIVAHYTTGKGGSLGTKQVKDANSQFKHFNSSTILSKVKPQKACLIALRK